MGSAAERAEQLFLQGYNCSQSVAAAFAPELGLEQDTLLALASGFGAGFGRLRMVCGAFSGATLVLGLWLNMPEPEQKNAVYAEEQELARRFCAFSGGSMICSELLQGRAGADTAPKAAARTAEYYGTRPCIGLVREAAAMLEQYLCEHPHSAAGVGDPNDKKQGAEQ